jgi:ABC-type branched-subunit amino acid transport system ATPase component/branched-subunit amino acid ABC-type transport system permease component
VDKFLTFLVSGAATGLIFSLVASGLTLSYSATGIFNLAYGGVAFSSAYLFYEFNTSMHWPQWAAFLIIVLVYAPLLGLLLDSAVLRRLARANEAAKLVSTVGLLLAIPALTEWIMDGIINIFNVDIARSSTVLEVGLPSGLGPVPDRTYHLPGQIPITSDQIVILITAVLCAGLLWYLMRHTAIGLKMRAVVDRSDLARTRGINDVQTSRYAWVIGTMLAAIAGVVGAPVLGALNTNSYTVVVFVAAAAAVFGKLKNIPMALLGGILLGVAETMVTGYATFASNISGFDSAVPVIILLGSLIYISRQRTRRAGSASEEAAPPDYLAHLPKWRRALPWTLATVFLIFYITILSNTFWAGVMAQGLALSLIFLSFVVVTGMGGMVSLAQATFVSVAGLATGLFLVHFGWPFYGAAAFAIVLTVIVGVVVALPALRLGGLFLALATLALAIVAQDVLFQVNYISNSSSGWTMPRLHIGPFTLQDNRTMAIFCLIIVALVVLLIRNLRVSSWGRSIAAVRSSEVAAATSGISAVRVKLVLFAISAAIAGLGGILYASFQSTVSGMTAPYVEGLLWLATAVLFGIRRPAAAVYAGIASAATPIIISSGFHWWSWVPSWLSWTGTKDSEISLILFGTGALLLARSPDGFLAQGARQRWERMRKREAKRAAKLGETLEDEVAIIEAVTASEEAGVVERVQTHAESLAARGIVTNAPTASIPPGLLSIRDVRVAYGDVQVLHGVGLEVPAGSITALFGANGGGKSTLCSAISGLVPISSGSILFDGEEINAIEPYKRVDLGLLVAPESRGVFPGLTVEENLELRLSSADIKLAYERFPRLGERHRQIAGSLSGGEQQMLALAPVLVKPPRVAVVDEPTLGLAPLIIQQVLELLVELKSKGTAILVVEEKVRDVLTIADNVAFIELGRIVWAGKRDALDDERLAAVYLGTGNKA